MNFATSCNWTVMTKISWNRSIVGGSVIEFSCSLKKVYLLEFTFFLNFPKFLKSFNQKRGDYWSTHIPKKPKYVYIIYISVKFSRKRKRLSSTFFNQLFYILSTCFVSIFMTICPANESHQAKMWSKAVPWNWRPLIIFLW